MRSTSTAAGRREEHITHVQCRTVEGREQCGCSIVAYWPVTGRAIAEQPSLASLIINCYSRRQEGLEWLKTHWMTWLDILLENAHVFFYIRDMQHTFYDCKRSLRRILWIICEESIFMSHIKAREQSTLNQSNVTL
jgi:hypothetical protein